MGGGGRGRTSEEIFDLLSSGQLASMIVEFVVEEEFMVLEVVVLAIQELIHFHKPAVAEYFSVLSDESSKLTGSGLWS